MMQLGLFDASAPARTTPPPSAPAPADRPQRANKANAAPHAPPVVIADPQLPPLGAVAKIDGRWHQWNRVGVCGGARGWEILRPPEHTAHASDVPPRLARNGRIAEPLPKPAEISIAGVTLRVEWSEHGFGVHHGDEFMRHFREIAADAEEAKAIIQAQLLPVLQGMAKDGDAEAADAAAVLTGEAEEPDTRDEWRFEWRGLSIIGTVGPCFTIDKKRHPPGTPCFSSTGFRSFCSDAWKLAGQSAGRTLEDWSVAILDAYFAAPAKDGNGLGGKLEPWKAVPEPEPLDPMLQQLVDAGLISTYSARWDTTLQDMQHKERPAPWNAPSRLFQFPCSLHAAMDGEPARLVIWAERMAEHPFVREIAAATGLEPIMAEGRETWGFSQAHGTYHHAVDLISAGRWKQLVQLREFSDESDILCAVNYGLDYGHLAAREAAALLNAVGIPVPKEPTSPLHSLRAVEFGTCKDDKGKERRTISWKLGPGSVANTWARIAGFERGWFKVNRSGFSEWTDKAKVEQRNLRIAAGETVPPQAPPDGALL